MPSETRESYVREERIIERLDGLRMLILAEKWREGGDEYGRCTKLKFLPSMVRTATGYRWFDPDKDDWGQIEKEGW